MIDVYHIEIQFVRMAINVMRKIVVLLFCPVYLLKSIVQNTLYIGRFLDTEVDGSNPGISVLCP